MTVVPIFQSRRFWTVILDTVISLILFIIGNYYPEWQDRTTQLIAILQPVFLVLIAAFTVEGTATIKANAKVEAWRQMYRDPLDSSADLEGDEGLVVGGKLVE